MNRFQSFLSAGLIAACGASAMAVEIDVAAFIDQGKIRTIGYIDATGQFFGSPSGPDVRVFAYNFDEGIAVSPQIFLDDPGFNAEEFESEFGQPTGFAPGSHLGIAIQSALQFWDGSGLPIFGVADPSASLTLANFTAERDVDATTFDTTPFFVFEVEDAPEAGAYHGHITSILNDDTVPAGIYAFQAIVINGELTNSSTGEGTIDSLIEASDPIWFLYNVGLAEDDFEDAVEAFIASLDNGTGPGGPAVPEPATIALLAGSMLAFVRRSDRQRQ